MDVNMILLDMDNFDEDKYSILKTVGTKCVSAGIYPLMALFMSEAWTRNFTPEEEKERRKQKRKISDYDDRHESLAMMGSTITGLYAVASAIMHRDENDCIVRYDAPIYYLADDPVASKIRSDLLEAFWAGVRDGAMAKYKLG
jgi:hypothetical protein